MCMHHLPFNNTVWKQEKVYELTLRRPDVLNHQDMCVTETNPSSGRRVTAWADEYNAAMSIHEQRPDLLELRRFLIGNMSCKYMWGTRKGNSIWIPSEHIEMGLGSAPLTQLLQEVDKQQVPFCTISVHELSSIALLIRTVALLILETQLSEYNMLKSDENLQTILTSIHNAMPKLALEMTRNFLDTQTAQPTTRETTMHKLLLTGLAVRACLIWEFECVNDMIHLILINTSPYEVTGKYVIRRVQGIIGTDRLQVIKLQARVSENFWTGQKHARISPEFTQLDYDTQQEFEETTCMTMAESKKESTSTCCSTKEHTTTKDDCSTTGITTLKKMSYFTSSWYESDCCKPTDISMLANTLVAQTCQDVTNCRWEPATRCVNDHHTRTGNPTYAPAASPPTPTTDSHPRMVTLSSPWTFSRTKASVTGLVISGLTTLVVGSPSTMATVSCTYPCPIFSGYGTSSHIAQISPVTTGCTSAQCRTQATVTALALAGVETFYTDSLTFIDVPCRHWSTSRARARVTITDFTGTTTIADDSWCLLRLLTTADYAIKTCVDAIGVAVFLILKLIDNVKTSVVAALDAEDDVLIFEITADADLKELVSPEVLVGGSHAQIHNLRIAPLGYNSKDRTVMLPRSTYQARNLRITPVDTCGDGVGGEALLILEEENVTTTSVVKVLITENVMLLLETHVDAEVEVLVPPAMMVDAVSATGQGRAYLVLTKHVIPGVDDDLCDSTRAKALLDTGVHVTMNPAVSDTVDATTIGLTTVVNDNVLLLNTCVVGVRLVVIVILKVVDNANSLVDAALGTESDVPLLEATANADVEVIVPPVVLASTIPASVKGSNKLVLTALTVLDIDRDELLDSDRTEVMVGKGVDTAMNPVVFEDVHASTLVLPAVTVDNVLLLNTCAHGIRMAVPDTHKVLVDINTSVITDLVAEDDVLLLETDLDEDVEVVVYCAVLVDNVSVPGECSEVLVFNTLTVHNVDGDNLIYSTGTQVMVGTGVVVQSNTVVLNNAEVSTLVLIAVTDEDTLLLKACVNGVEVGVIVILQQVDDVNMYVNTVLVAEDDVLLLEDAVETDVEVLVSAAVIRGAVSITIEYSTVP